MHDPFTEEESAASATKRKKIPERAQRDDDLTDIKELLHTLCEKVDRNEKALKEIQASR